MNMIANKSLERMAATHRIIEFVHFGTAAIAHFNR
jgi:hypothetical protein